MIHFLRHLFGRCVRCEAEKRLASMVWRATYSGTLYVRDGELVYRDQRGQDRPVPQ